LPEEVTPIHPDVGDKLIKVNMTYQTLSAFEGSREVYFCEISTGGPDGTPLGNFPIWRKMISTHMSAGGLVAYDTPGIGWTTLSMVKALRFTLHSGIIILAQRFPMVVLTADRKMLSGSGDGLTRK